MPFSGDDRYPSIFKEIKQSSVIAKPATNLQPVSVTTHAVEKDTGVLAPRCWIGSVEVMPLACVAVP